jgi:hypothetical protein
MQKQPGKTEKNRAFGKPLQPIENIALFFRCAARQPAMAAVNKLNVMLCSKKDKFLLYLLPIMDIMQDLQKSFNAV